VSLRVRNFESDTLKVNDAAGNPVEIAAVVNWQVADTATALFDVENYNAFVSIQAETAVRHVASKYPYEAYEENQLSRPGTWSGSLPTSEPTSCRTCSSSSSATAARNRS
jgi:SPFH domain / Band 7 family